MLATCSGMLLACSEQVTDGPRYQGGGSGGQGPMGSGSTGGVLVGDGGSSSGGSSGGGGTGGMTDLPSCRGVDGPTVRKTYSPDLFRQGGDPSGAFECTDVLNPERGVFQFHDLRNLGSLTGLRAAGYTLIYGKVAIGDYVDKDVDEALTTQLQTAFASARAAGIKVLPRVYYADNAASPDAPLSRVLAHIEQLGPIWRDNADVIAAVHAGFVGAWGEWHGSTNALTEPDARKQIFDALLEEVPSDRMILARRPSHKDVAYGGPLTAQTAFDGTSLARIGHLNDCFLASESDMGTYQLEGEKEYAIADSAFSVTGGETCAVNPPRSQCEAALAELALHHWSFINTSYHQDVLASWEADGCMDRIRCQLGYRFAVLEHVSPETVQAGDNYELSLEVFNDGFARLYNPRPVYLVFSGPTEYVARTDADPRLWAPGETTSICMAVTLPNDLPEGTYQVSLWLPDAASSLEDDARYALRFASGASWDEEKGFNVLDTEVVVVR